MESEPAKRNFIGLLQKHPEIGRNGIRLRQIGQAIIRLLGGKSVHPSWTLPGGVGDPLSPEELSEIKSMLPDGFHIIQLALDLLNDMLSKYEAEIENYGNFPSLFMGLVTPDGGLEHYDGLLLGDGQ